jgi:hypothetical protein
MSGTKCDVMLCQIPVEQVLQQVSVTPGPVIMSMMSVEWLSYVSHVTGITGRPVLLTANYFRLPTVTNWQLYQYRVNFVPSEDSKSAKHKMVRDHKEELGGYLFDGTMLYTSSAYDEDVSQIFFLFIICVMILKLIS